MKITAQLYGQLRDVAGKSKVEVIVPEAATISNLLEQLYAQIPALRLHDKNILLGAGVEFVDRNYKLKPQEEIAVMPPVQGG